MAISLLLFVIAAVSKIDGTDLYFFVCHGRDFAMGYQPSQPASYLYFPGVYRVWSVVFYVFPVSVFVVQWTVMIALLLNAVLVGALVYRLANSFWFSCVGASLYVALSTRFEGLQGTGEPMATLPFLFGIVCWLSLSKDVLRFAFFGIAIGLTVYMKQQAGLLSLGVASIFIWPSTDTATSPWFTGRWKPPFILAGIAVLVFLSSMLLEGRGLLPLKTGLEMLHRYEGQGSWIRNLSDLIRNDEVVALLAMVCACGMGLAVFQKAGFDDRHAHAFGLLCLSSVATLLQFRVRGYYHYFLLSLPSLVVVATVVTAIGLRHIYDNRSGRSTLQRNVLLILLAAPLVIGFARVGQRALAFEMLHPSRFTNASESEGPWHLRPEVLKGIQEMKTVLEPGDELLVLPPVRSAIYFATGTVNSEGYAFGEFADVSQHSVAELSHVAFLPQPRSERDEKDWQDSKSELLLQELSSDSNFEQLQSSMKLQLFHRHP
ncbi:MAG: hypothetical protein ABJZ55_25975 [Fuerstiella sp.]